MIQEKKEKKSKFSDRDVAYELSVGTLKDSIIYDEMQQAPIWANKPKCINSVSKTGDIVCEDDAIAIYTYLGKDKKYFGSVNNINHIYSGLRMFTVAKEFRINPLVNYLNTCHQKWDGQSRVKDFFVKYCDLRSDSKNLKTYEAVAKAFFVQCVKRPMEPGCKADYMLILQGLQGSYKSTLIKILGGQYASDTSIDVDSRDGVSKLRGKWLIEFAELSSLNNKESNSVKNFITQPTDEYRAAYGKFNEVHKRTCCFIGTTNDECFLKDATGNRRFWIAPVGKIDIAAIKADVDQLWGEAMAMYLAGEATYLSKHDESVMNSIAEDRTDYDPFMDRLKNNLDLDEKYTFTDLYVKLNEKAPAFNGSPVNKRIRACMSRMGFEFKAVKQGGITRNFFVYSGPTVEIFEVEETFVTEPVVKVEAIVPETIIEKTDEELNAEFDEEVDFFKSMNLPEAAE